MRDLFEEYLTEEQVAAFLGISVRTLRNRICLGRDHPPVLQGIRKFHKDSFADWLKKREVKQVNQAS